MKTIQAKPLNFEDYQNYGGVVSARDELKPFPVNQGTAQRFNHAATLENLRPGKAKPNLCVFRSDPVKNSPFEIHLLEKHPYSTQTFIPMAGSKRFLVIVCLGDDNPDLNTLRAFVATNAQGISYKPGTWHHPLIALDETTDFACLVWEDGSAGDYTEKKLDSPIYVHWSSSVEKPIS